MRITRVAHVVLAALVLLLPACASRTKAPASVGGAGRILEAREGLASYYGPGFEGKATASGTRFDMNAMVAAHIDMSYGAAGVLDFVREGRTRVRVEVLRWGD